MGLPTRVGGSFSAVWPGLRALHQELRVSLKVPPHVVRVKYKTTRSSGGEVDTPRTRRFMRPTSVFLGFSCGKLRQWASFAGFCNPSFTQLSQTIAAASPEQGARVVQLRFLLGGNVERQRLGIRKLRVRRAPILNWDLRCSSGRELRQGCRVPGGSYRRGDRAGR